MSTEKKTALKAVTKRTWSLRLMWMIAVGYNRTIWQSDKYNYFEQQDWYLLCFRLQATQWFKSKY